MTETSKTRRLPPLPLLVWRRSLRHAPKRLRPLLAVVSSGSKILETNRISCFLWLLLPLFLILSSDWIGILVVFQAMTTALRLRNAPRLRSSLPVHPRV